FHGHVLTGYFGPTGNLLVRLAERSLARLTDRIVTISPSQQADIVSRYQIAPADKTTMIPLGLDLRPLLDSTSRVTLRSQLSVSEREIVIGYVGRFVPIKALPTLI